jgi:hypothetical protein
MEKLAIMFTPPAGRKPNGSRSPRARFFGHVTAVGNNHPITCLDSAPDRRNCRSVSHFPDAL